MKVKKNWTLHDLEKADAYARGYFDGLNVIKASAPFKTYVYKGRYGLIYIDAMNRAEALKEAAQAQKDLAFKIAKELQPQKQSQGFQKGFLGFIDFVGKDVLRLK